MLVGVGQASERLEDDDYRGLSPVDLAVAAVEVALADAGLTADAVDTVAATRQFETSTPGAPAPRSRG